MLDWDDIVDQFGGVVWNQALRMLGHRADAADCFQVVMIEAVEASRREDVLNWAGFLRRLTILRSLDILRSRYRVATDPRPIEDVPLVEPTAIDPHKALERQELAERLRYGLSRLPEEQAEAFSLRWIDGLSNTEVAERMQLTANHVGVLLHRARANLQSLLRKEGWPHD